MKKKEKKFKKNEYAKDDWFKKSLKKIDSNAYEIIFHPKRFKEVRKKTLFGKFIKLERKKKLKN